MNSLHTTLANRLLSFGEQQPESLNIDPDYTLLKKASEDKVIMVMIKAQWCGHCTTFEPVWDAAAENMKSVRWFKYDESDRRTGELMSALGATSYPSIYKFKGQTATKMEPKDRSLEKLLSFAGR
jgi:thiol-disulfide isomerase/thioredoxin